MSEGFAGFAIGAVLGVVVSLPYVAGYGAYTADAFYASSPDILVFNGPDRRADVREYVMRGWTVKRVGPEQVVLERRAEGAR